MAKKYLYGGINILLIASMIGGAYFGVRTFKENPCAVPKTFSVTDVDPRFSISRDDVIAYAKEAATLWNKEYSRNEVLTYIEKGGDVTITLTYDDRQRTTIQNERLKRTIEEEKGELYEIKDTIESLRETYASLESTIDRRTDTYESKLSKHNKEVAHWNSRGGAPRETYQRLESEQEYLDEERAFINDLIVKYNDLSKKILEYNRTHNMAVETINQKIYTLNKTAVREFEEGTYDPNNETITIYEFENSIALKRVLMHELGHAIGLNHVSDEEAIMYPVNQGKGISLTEDDKEELSNVCREKTFTDAVAFVRIIRDDIFHLVGSSLLGTVAQQG